MDYKMCCLRNKDKQAGRMKSDVEGLCAHSWSVLLLFTGGPGARQWELFQCHSLTQRRLRWHYEILFPPGPSCSLCMQHTHLHVCFLLDSLWLTFALFHYFTLWHICWAAKTYFLLLLLPSPFNIRLFTTVFCIYHLLHETSTSVLLHPSAIQSHSVNNDRQLCSVLLCAVTRRQHGAQSAAGQEQQTLEAGLCWLHS